MEDCKVTWEKEEAIPKSILEEYEADVLVDVQQLSTKSMGHTSHTLSVTTREKNPEPDSKKQKTDRITVQCDNGLVKNYVYLYRPIGQVHLLVLKYIATDVI